MSADTTSTGKLIRWDDATPIEDARTVKATISSFPSAVYDPPWNSDWAVENTVLTDRYVYNYNMIYDDAAHVAQPNLSAFHAIDDPTNTSKKNIDWNCDLILCCSDVLSFLFTSPLDTEINPKIDYKVHLNADYDGAIQSITIDYGKNLINLKGIVI